MSEDKTANCMRTLSEDHGSTEAHRYHTSVRNDKITSDIVIPELSDIVIPELTNELGVENYYHRLEIERNIRDLFPHMTERDFEQSLSNMCISPELVQSVTQSDLDTPYCSTSQEDTSMWLNSPSPSLNDMMHKNDVMHSNDIMSISCSPEALTRRGPIRIDSRIAHQAEDTGTHCSQFCLSPNIITERISDRIVIEEPKFGAKLLVGKKKEYFNRRLFVKLTPDQLVSDKTQQILLIREQFTNIGVDVDIRSTRKNPHIYEVFFANPRVAREVLQRSKGMKYELSKHWLHRPRPTHPWKYKALRTLVINSGRSEGGLVVGKVEEGVTLEVNQVKGRRGRMIRYKDNGGTENVGWVSLRSRDGTQLMKQLNYL